MKISRSWLNLGILTAFVFIALGINFFHSETSLNGSNSCPACHFQNSTLTTVQSTVFVLPQLELFDFLKANDTAQYNQIYYIQPSSRSPPLI